MTVLLAGCNSPGPCTSQCECTVDADCAGLAHTTCFEKVCTCVAGYADAADGCVWAGVVNDPGFNMTPDQWMTSGQASIHPGQLVLSTSDPSCGSFGTALQSVTMPRASRAEPLVFATTFNTGGAFEFTDVRPAIVTGSAEIYPTSRVCLGAAHYAPESSVGLGAEVPFALTGQGSRCAGSLSDLDIYRFDIVPATADDDCPEPGQVLNGDAEGDGGWTFYTDGSGASASYAPGVGANGSTGIRLSTTLDCETATATVPVSVPLPDATGSPALSVFHSGQLTASLGQVFASDGVRGFETPPVPLSGSGAPTIDRYCVPAPQRGTVVPFTATIYHAVPPPCTSVANLEGIVDDVTVANDPACGTSALVSDPGFESGLMPLGRRELHGSSVAVVADSQAHSGQHDLAITVRDACATGTFETLVSAPLVHPGEGAAVSFYYRLSPGTSTLRVSGAPSFTPTRDGEWHQAFACIESRVPGRAEPFRVALETSRQATTCAPIPAETVRIDDLAVVSTPMCPSTSSAFTGRSLATAAP